MRILTYKRDFTFVANGEDTQAKKLKVNGNQKYMTEYFNVLQQLSAKDFDCFQSSSKLKDSLAEYVINGVKSVDKKNELFEKGISTLER